MNSSNKTLAREHCLKFLYQCEIEKIYYFSSTQFDHYASYYQLVPGVKSFAAELCQATFDHLSDLDASIEAASANWTLARMAIIDRCIIRLAACELLHIKTPKKVVINEAIELAKEFGTENSGKFVNGLLDNLAQKMRKDHNQ